MRSHTSPQFSLSVWHGARRPQGYCIWLHVQTINPWEACVLFFLFLFVSECPTRWGVDDPAASSRHQLEGQGGAGKSLHSNYYSNLPNTCNYRGNHTRQPNTVKYQRTQLEPGRAGKGDLCTKVPLSEIHANNWIQCYCCINTHCSKEAYIV